MEIELLFSAVSFLTGLGTGYLRWGRRPSRIELIEGPSNATATIEHIVERIVHVKPAPRPTSPNRCAVVFRFIDGSEESKTLFKHSIECDLLWRDKLFAYQPSTSDPLIYNEVTQ